MLRLRYRYVCFSIFWLNFNFTSLIRIWNTILDSIRFVRGSEFFLRSPPTTQRASLARRLRSTFIYLISSQCCLLFPIPLHSRSSSSAFFCLSFLFAVIFSFQFLFFSRNIVLTCCWVSWPVSGLAAVLLMFITQEMKRDFFMIFSSELRQNRILAVSLRSKRSLLCCCVAAFPISHFTMVFRLYEDDEEEKKRFFWLVSWLICEMMMTKRRIDQKRIVKNHEPSSVERDSLACICLIDHFQIYFFFFKKQNRSLRRFFPSFHLCSLLGTTSPFYLCQRCVAPTLRLRF